MSFFSPQVGFVPSGVAQDGRTIIGRDYSVTWEAVGFGPGGRPDGMMQLQINFTRVSGVAAPVKFATVNLDVSTLVAAQVANPNVPSTGLNFAFREVAVCENGSSKRMMVIASQTYSA